MEEINYVFVDPTTWIIVLAVIALIFIIATNYYAFKYFDAQKSIKNKPLRKEVANLKLINSENKSTLNAYAFAMKVAEDFTQELAEENKRLNERIEWLTETIEHRKHFKLKVKETGYWTPSGTKQSYTQFELGKSYKQVHNGINTNCIMYLDDGTGILYVVDKSNFKPAIK